MLFIVLVNSVVNGTTAYPPLLNCSAFRVSKFITRNGDTNYQYHRVSQTYQHKQNELHIRETERERETECFQISYLIYWFDSSQMV